MNMKRSVLVGATMATLSVGGLGVAGIASAATTDSSDTSTRTSIVDKIASKFNLNKTEVQAVFDEEHATRQAEREADQKQKLAEAVTAGKITQAQSDYITKAQAELKELRGTTMPGDVTDEQREAMKTKMDALRDWAETNNVDMQYVMGGHGGPGGPGGHGMRADDDKSSDRNSIN